MDTESGRSPAGSGARSYGRPCPFCGHDMEPRGEYFRHPTNDCILRNFDIYATQLEAWNVRKEVGSILTDIGVMMSEFVDNWPHPKKVGTALALVAKTLRAALDADAQPSPPRNIK